MIIFINKILLKIRSKSLIRDSITTTIWSTIGKAVGFIIPFFIAAWFGVTSETDSFFFAYGVIIFLSGIFAPVVEKVIVPYIIEEKENSDNVSTFIGSVLVVGSVGLFIISGIVLLVSKPILLVITRFDTEAINLIFRVLIETAPLIMLHIWTSVLAGTLNAHKRFAMPALSPVFRALVNLLVIFAFKNIWGVHAIVFGYIVGELFRMLILFSFIYKKKLFTIRLSFNISNKIREFLKTASYQVLGMLVVGLSPIIDKTMASWLKVGSVSVLEYANRLYMIPIAFVSMGLMVTLLSYWSERYYKLGKQKLKEDVKRGVKVVILIAIIITIVLIIFSQPIVSMAFGRGEFDQEKLPEVDWVFVFYLVGFVPYMVGQVFVQAHLVLKNTKILLKCGIYMGLLNILLNYILMRFFEVAGISLATSFVSVFSLCYLGIIFYKRFGKES